MQNRPLLSQTAIPAPTKSYPKNPQIQDQLARIFNTALVSTKNRNRREFSTDLKELTQSLPFKTILNAVRQLSTIQGIPERAAAEEIIQTFRKLDDLWCEYIFQEGLDKLKNSRKERR